MNTKKLFRNFRTKGLVIVTIISFAVIIFIGCVPTPGTGSLKNGTFHLNMKVSLTQQSNQLIGPSIEKTILLYDGDKLLVKAGIAFETNGGISRGVLISCVDKNNNLVDIEAFGYHQDIFQDGMFFNNDNDFIQKTSNGYLIKFIDYQFTNTYMTNEGFVVFRKKEYNSNEYIYTWIKYKDGSGLINGEYRADVQVLNGKYQMNSITTGL